MKHTPIEALLRPPVEWYSTLVSGCAAILVLVQPGWFLLTPEWSYAFVGVFTLLAVKRFFDGLKPYRYQKRLRQQKSYTLDYSTLSNKQNKETQTFLGKLYLGIKYLGNLLLGKKSLNKNILLGKGFQWQPIHTQRLRDLDRPENSHYRAQRSQDGEPALHGVSFNEQLIYMPMQWRYNHLFVLGTPGVGKTRFAELLISQDIHRGETVIVIDPKGDSDLLKRMVIEAKRAGRERDVMAFHLGFPEQSARYNPISRYNRITEIANRVANQLPATGNSAAFKEFGWRFINTIAQVLIVLSKQPTYLLLRRYIHDIPALVERYFEAVLPIGNTEFEEWISVYSKNNSQPDRGITITLLESMVAYAKEHPPFNEDNLMRDVINAFEYEKTYYDSITASLGPLLAKLTTDSLASLLSPSSQDKHDKRFSLNWEKVIADKHIVYIGLDALSDNDVATAVGNAMLADLTALAGQLYNQQSDQPVQPINLHVDEASDVVGDEFIPMLNKARGAGFRVTVYTQTVSDLQARLQNEAKAKQMLGNMGTLVMFRVNEAKTAELLLNQLPQVPINDITQLSSVNDTANAENGVYFHSHNEDRLTTKEVSMLTTNDLLNLPKGHAFVLLAGKLYKIQVPLPLEESNDLPSDVAEILKQLNPKLIKS